MMRLSYALKNFYHSLNKLTMEEEFPWVFKNMQLFDVLVGNKV